MAKNPEAVSLPEEDYLAILDNIKKFYECKTRAEIQQTFQDQLIPMLNATSGIVAWGNPEIAQFKLICSANMSDNDEKIFFEYIPHNNLSKQMGVRGRSVLAYDLDLPREEYVEERNKYLKDRPGGESENYSYIKQISTAMVTVNIPEVTLGIGIHRLFPNTSPFTLREARMLELLSPHILHSIQTVILREELAQYKSLATKLSEVESAVALVTESSRIVFCNKPFKDLFLLKEGGRLPKAMGDLVNREVARNNPPYDVETSAIELPFYEHEGALYRLELTGLGENDQESEDLWLLWMKPAIEPFSKMNRRMQEAGLTKREMEICVLVKDGILDEDAASRLFISVHTVRNHIKSIHRKLNVNTRGQLVALLNQQ